MASPIQDDEISEEIHSANGFRDKINGNASESALRVMNTDALLKRMQEMREDVLEHVNSRINNMMSEVLQKTETYLEKKKEVLDDVDKYCDKIQSNEKGKLPDKIFLERNSILTDLFRIPHIRAVYNIFIVTHILLFLNTVAYDIMDSGTILIGTSTIMKCFAKFPTCLYIWSQMMISTLAVYLAVNLWAYRRLEFSPKSVALKIWDYGWLTGLISYYVFFIVFPTKAMLNENLPIACSIIVLMEQIRLLMKTHAFVRSIAPRFLSYKSHTETPKPSSPEFSHYLYFLFAPTLIYCDSYLRTKKIRWNFVIRNFIEVGLIIFYYAFLMEHFTGPIFKIFGTQPLEWRWFVKSILKAMIPGFLCFVSAFYCLLHAWLNGWAELLRFADRLFYKDWWNCTSYRSYYRTWNVVVHDWLYTYVYKDMYEIVVPRNKFLATTSVFFISSVFHEYIVAFVFRFFYPVMLIMFFGIGFAMTFVGKKAGNIFMWLSWFMGNGLMLSLYAIEYYARINCQPYDNEFLDLFLPRSWSCQ